MCENEIVVKNTLAFQFPGNAAQPTLADMACFVKSLKGDRSKMDTAYKISDKKSVFIRFKCEDAMMFTLENNATTLPFHYTDGSQVMVRMLVAGANARYVRVFDLPPEATDADLSSVLGKYGTIRRVVRERFPVDSGLDMGCGVRGLYMDIEREIPEILYFRGWKGRIYFPGVKLKCYVCKSDTHLKKACPIVKVRRDEGAKQQKEQQQQQEQECVVNKPPATGLEEGKDGAEARVTASGAISKQKNKSNRNNNRKTETKRQLSVDSDTNSQPQEKKKTGIQPAECERTTRKTRNDSIVIVDCTGMEHIEISSDAESIDENDVHLLSSDDFVAWMSGVKKFKKKKSN